MESINYKYFIISFCCSIALLLSNFFSLAGVVKSSSAGLILPLQYGMQKSVNLFSKEFTFILDARQLSRQVSDDEKQITELKAKVASFVEIERENETLKSHLDVRVSVVPPDIYAHVVGRTQSSGAASLLVDRGSRDSIKEGQIATWGNALVGRVSTVYVSSSIITLISDNSFKVAALDQDSPQRAKGVVSGQFATSLLMEKIYQNEEIKVGDTIVTSGEDNVFPKGILIGKISGVKDSSEQLLKNATVKPEVDLTTIEEVFIRQ